VNWAALTDFAELAVVALGIIAAVFSVFRKPGRYLAERPLHVTISTVLLFLLSLINFGVVFALAWNGDAGFDNVILVSGIALCANFYAAWNQPIMVWKGGLILCGYVLLLACGSVFEDNATQKFAFWFSRAAAIYLSALVGGVLGRFISPSFSRI
jgi:hypothetical protein